MNNKALFTRVELLCGLFKSIATRIYVTSENGTVLSTPVTQFINQGGGTVILSNYRTSTKNDPDYNRSFTTEELANLLMQTHESVGDNVANRITIRILIYNFAEGRQIKVADKELYMIEVDTIRRIIMLTDGSDVIL